MGQPLWTGPPDPPVVKEPMSSFRMRVSIFMAFGMVLIGPVMACFGLAFSISDVYLVNEQYDRVLRLIANIGVILGAVMTVCSLG